MSFTFPSRCAILLSFLLPLLTAASRRCNVAQVQSGDSCETLADKCGVDLAAFASFNPSPGLCSSLLPGQFVCCSAGSGVFPRTAQRHFGRRTLALSMNSTCADLENFQAQNDDLARQILSGLSPIVLQQGGSLSGHITASMWDSAQTSDFYDNWRSQWADDQTLEADFANRWGVGQSTQSLDISNIGNAPDCTSIENYKTAPGSGPAYMVLLSMYNVGHALKLLHDAINQAIEDWNTLQVSTFMTFDHVDSNANHDALVKKEIALSIGTGIGAALALTGNPVLGAIGALAGGIAGIIATAIQPPMDTTFKDLASFERAVSTIVTTARSQVEAMFTDFKHEGISHNVDFKSLFADGAWLDARQVPILKTDDSSGLNALVKKHIDAAAINWAWRKQRVWLMSYPMTQDDFNGYNDVKGAGNGDFRLKHYYNGRGYYFMSMGPTKYIQDPPGWGDLGQWGIDTHQVIESSAQGFALGGFANNVAPDFVALATQGFDASANSMSLPGVWSIPICALDNTFGWTPDVAGFFRALAGPGAMNNNDDRGGQPPICYCRGIKDPQGVLFDDQIDPGSWSDLKCGPAENNLPGGPRPKPKDPTADGDDDSLRSGNIIS